MARSSGPGNFALRKARERREGAMIPREAHLEVTHRCNLRCYHCYLGCGPGITAPNDLSTGEWKRVLDELFGLGVFYVTFSGGEPLCRPDMLELMEHAKERGLFFCLITNGTLISPEVAGRIRDAGAVGVDVSLHGATAAGHEAVTGVAGSFEASVRALELLRQTGMRIGVKATMMSGTAGDQAGIQAIARRLGARYQSDPMVIPRVGRAGSADGIRMNDEQLRKLVIERDWASGEEPASSTLESHLICGAGRSRCTIASDGEVHPCTVWRVPLGSVREGSFAQIWGGEPLRRIREIAPADMKRCVRCEHVNSCARCPGLIHLEGGDILGPSSENCRLASTIRGVRNAG